MRRLLELSDRSISLTSLTIYIGIFTSAYGLLGLGFLPIRLLLKHNIKDRIP